MEIENEKDQARREVKWIIEWMEMVRQVLGRPKAAAKWGEERRRRVREAVGKAVEYCVGD